MSDKPQLFGKTLFVDLMMGTLVVVTALLMASKQVDKEEEQKKQEQAHLATDGLYAIVMTWPDGSQDDVDLYVRSPTGKIAFFRNQDVDLMKLERDDYGGRNDSVTTAIGTIKVDKNEERTIIRGAIPGEYVVNVQMYAKHDATPTPVKISLYRLRGEDTELKSVNRILAKNGDEETAFRFTLDAAGEPGGINELPVKMVGALHPSSGPINPFAPGGL
jgi:hypothetical protein